MGRPRKVQEQENPEERVARISRNEERGESLAKMWEIAAPRIKAMVPQHVNDQRLLASLLTAVARNPDLSRCTPLSLIREAIRAAQMGFDVSGIGGKAYLVPFRNNDAGTTEAQLIVGYRGLEELARRTGQIAAIYSREIYANEDFEYQDGLIQIISHRPVGPLTAEEQPVGAYAIAVWTNGFRQGEVMNKVQLEKIRAMSKVPNGPAWSKSLSEMYRKTVTRRLCKRLPDSLELSVQLDNEERMDRGETPSTTIDVLPEPEAKKSRTDTVRARVAAQLVNSSGEAERALEQLELEAEDGATEREPGEEG